MSSILTNNSAMVALQTMKSINKNMGKVQGEISTGLKVATAKDNAATWAIASVMRSDVKGLSAVSETLALGSSTVGVARTAAETVTELLTEAKERILGGGDLTNEDTRNKLAADLVAIGNQIETIVSSASFNGLNLVDGLVATDINVISSLSRADDGTLSVETITVERQDLSAIAGVLQGWTEASLLNQAAIDTTLGALESELTVAVDAAAAFGTAQKQIEIQASFVGKFSDAIKSGIGAMVDADMEEASARLQALQVQQQLATQSLSIANQAPQNILALFR
jgi:flagellin